LRTDANGQFAVQLPPGISGRVYVFGEGSAAAALDV
jgi:hypothetical protein